MRFPYSLTLLAGMLLTTPALAQHHPAPTPADAVRPPGHAGHEPRRPQLK